MSDPKIVNLSELPWTLWSTSERIGVEIKDPARKVGSTHCGLRVYRLAAGMQSTLRHGDREVSVKAGDFILYPAGDPAAHTFVNSGAAPLQYIATGDRVAYEVCEYPDDGTVYVEAIDKTLRNEDVPSERAAREAWYKAGR